MREREGLAFPFLLLVERDALPRRQIRVALSDQGQRRRQIGDEIIGMFDTNRDTQHP